MAGAAPMMAICGIGSAAASGVIAIHILAMYAPAAIAGPWLARLGAAKIAVAGLAMILVALAAAGRAGATLPFAALMALGGCGWSLAMLGATVAIHRDCAPSPRLLALHDGALFAAAVAGALWR